jgi:quinol-cytochrome oxidoreductase complex cytochrome b subunit
MYYKPAAEAAYDSVRFIDTHVPMGWLLRQMHAWGAHLMIIVVIVHMLRVYFNKAYRCPRELTWVAGSLLLMITLAFAFTGYLLPWDQLSYWASTVGTQLADSVPLVGSHVLILLRGGTDVTHLTLSRFCAIHTIVLPAAAAALMMAHFVVIRRLGISDPM